MNKLNKVEYIYTPVIHEIYLMEIEGRMTPCLVENTYGNNIYFNLNGDFIDCVEAPFYPDDNHIVGKIVKPRWIKRTFYVASRDEYTNKKGDNNV